MCVCASIIYMMWLKQSHKPPIWEWHNIPPTKMVMTGGWFIVLPTSCIL